MNQLKKLFIILTVLVFSAAGAKAEERTFKWSFQSDVTSLDPYLITDGFTLSLLKNVYESLASYDENLQLTPGLATKWENVSPTKWIFHLRKGVKFHNGSTFNADDVVFSWNRVRSPDSNFRPFGEEISEIKIIDDYTIEVSTRIPNPILPRELVIISIMDKEWTEAHNAGEVSTLRDGDVNSYTNFHTNGTGPFIVTERQRDEKTVFKRFDGYWGEVSSNITGSIFIPITQSSTRVAALMSGDVDLIYPLPVQDWTRIEGISSHTVLKGAELRTIFLGIDQGRDELLYSNIKGKNPLKDVRVRAAFAHALNLDAINKKVMRGAATPTGLLVAPKINGFVPSLNKPYAYDPEKSKKLLREAGYPDGFEITLDCPNDRYVNDYKICQVVANMLAKVGVKVNVLAQPKSKFFAKILGRNDYDTSFYLFGWTPSTTDSHNVLKFLLSCQDKDAGVGRNNIGNYCNPIIDDLTKKVGVETDKNKRQAMIEEAFTIAKREYAYIPLHQQPLSWGINSSIRVKQRADNALEFRYVILP